MTTQNTTHRTQLTRLINSACAAAKRGCEAQAVAFLDDAKVVADRLEREGYRVAVPAI